MSIQADVVISPATSTSPVVVAVSQATRAIGSCAKIASSTLSEIWSHSLSGCPSVTDSLVTNAFGFFIKLLIINLLSETRKKHSGQGRRPMEVWGVCRIRKDPWIAGVLELWLIPPHLADRSAGIGTLPAT